MMPSSYNLCLPTLLLSLLHSHASATPFLSRTLLHRQDASSSPNLAVLGDSWGSGVAYSPFSTYDNNKDFCLRYSEAYGAQLEKDKDWPDSKQNTMQFLACSGSRLRDIAAESPQLNKITGPVDAVIMTTGGNDVGFFAVADACIYHSDVNRDYGPAFPNPDGDCQKALDTAARYIQGDILGSSLTPDIRATYQDMVQRDAIKNNGNVKIYHTGYGHFFNVKDEGDEDWCSKSNVSFNIPAPLRPASKNPSFLTLDLRTKINDLVQQVNDRIRGVTEEAEFSEKFRFIDISPAFEGHRFCEKGSSKSAQYYSSDVWLWNVVAPGLGALGDDTGPVPADLGQNPDFQFGDAPEVTEQTIQDNQVILFSDPRSGNRVINGWMLRPFHPKGSGYTEIKKIIADRLKADKIPGAGQAAVATPEPTPTATPAPQPSCPVSNDEHWPSCEECPNWEPSPDRCIAGEFSAACSCPDPCGNVNCIF